MHYTHALAKIKTHKTLQNKLNTETQKEEIGFSLNKQFGNLPKASGNIITTQRGGMEFSVSKRNKNFPNTEGEHLNFP